MSGETAARRRLEYLEQRILAIPPELPAEFWQLRDAIKRVLDQANIDGCLKQTVRHIKPPLYECRDPDGRGVAYINGGQRTETWAEANQFERDDGARFNFAIVAAYPPNKPPSLISYHFNLAFPDNRAPTFVRFDLNEAKFVSAARDAIKSPLLCHSHPGHGDMTVPSPMLSPLEVLDVILRMHLR